MKTNNRRILVVDDESLTRNSLSEMLYMNGYSVDTADDGVQALFRLEQKFADLVITDLKMPNLDGLALLKEIKTKYPDTAVVMITGYGSVESAVEAMRQGAYDYVTKPINDQEIQLVIERFFKNRNIIEENQYLRQKVQSNLRDRYFDIVGRNHRMQRIYDLIELVADTKSTVIIRGESGTGKRLVALAIHFSSSKTKDKPFIEVSCGALPETLLESELFGHVKGSFTGAIKDRSGRFELAEGGTIFLDEIDAFTPALQVKLLRVLQEGEFERVGDIKTAKANVRVIAATNQNLEELIKKGTFREDLYYRLNIISIDLPPLRERKEDIALLANYFIVKHAQEMNRLVEKISEKALEKLLDYHWPGNVRELENVIERAIVLSSKDSSEITDLHLPDNILKCNGKIVENGNGQKNHLKASLQEPERQIILEALNRTNWNKKEAAEILGINRTTLYKKLNQYGIILRKDNASQERAAF